MRRWWSADCHFGHGNIIKYCQRPFKDAEDMNVSILRNFRSRVHNEDYVVHVGDFCCKGNERGVEGVRTKSADWIMVMPGRWLMLAGNHDRNNGTKCVADYLFASVGGYSAFVTHWPLSSKKYDPILTSYIMEECDFVVCGHVHEKWGEQKIQGIWHINVGVDARRFIPIDDSELIEIWKKCMRKERDGV